MENKERQRLCDLREFYENAKKVCDPIEFQSRQKALLNKISEYLLLPLKDEAEEFHKKSLEDSKTLKL